MASLRSLVIWDHKSDPTQVNAPHFNRSQTGRYSIYLSRRDRRLSWPRWLVALHIPGQFTCTHRSSNRAWRRATSLIETNSLTTTPQSHPKIVSEREEIWPGGGKRKKDEKDKWDKGWKRKEKMFRTSECCMVAPPKVSILNSCCQQTI